MKKRVRLWLMVFILLTGFVGGGWPENGGTVKASVMAESYVRFQYDKRSEFKLSSGEIREGDSGKLSLEGKTVKNLTWTSSKPSVLSVDELGNVQALHDGSVTVTARYTYRGEAYRYSVTITVVDAWEAEERKFPTGTYWNDGSDADKVTNTPCSHIGESDDSGGTEGCTSNYFACQVAGRNVTGYQCHGFALKVADDIYGSSLMLWKYITSYRTPKVGDIIRINDIHTIIVMDVYGSSIEYADCNAEGDCEIQWGKFMTMAELEAAFTYMYSAR